MLSPLTRKKRLKLHKLEVPSAPLPGPCAMEYVRSWCQWARRSRAVRIYGQSDPSPLCGEAVSAVSLQAAHECSGPEGCAARERPSASGAFKREPVQEPRRVPPSRACSSREEVPGAPFVSPAVAASLSPDSKFNVILPAARGPFDEDVVSDSASSGEGSSGTKKVTGPLRKGNEMEEPY